MMPVGVFWAYSRNINRIQAEEDMRALQIARVAQADQKGYSEFLGTLKQEVGTVIVVEDVIDRKAVEELKRMKW